MKDILGRNIEEGDVIVKPARFSSHMWLNIYLVVDVWVTKRELTCRCLCRDGVPADQEKQLQVLPDNCLVLPPNWIPEDL